MPAIGSFELSFRLTGSESDRESEVATATKRKYSSAAEFHTFHCVDTTAFEGGFLFNEATADLPHIH
jgi:hypothetical protein